jgi:predicted metal-binding membrane protein
MPIEGSAAASTAARAAASGRPALFWTLMAALVAAAWAALAAWSASPYGRYLEHGGWADAGALAALCRAIPQGDIVVPAIAHAAAWVLMIAAMMLPTTFPLLAMFRRITGARPDAGRLAALVVLGFFAAWIAFGLLAHGADSALRWASAQSPWFIANGWAVGAVSSPARGCSSGARSSTAASTNAAPRSASSARDGTGGRRRAMRSGSVSTTGSSASAAAGR